MIFWRGLNCDGSRHHAPGSGRISSLNFSAIGAGEAIDIEPGGWIYKDRTVTMQTMFQKLSTGLFASTGQIVWNRFTGLGKIALQSMYFHMEGG